MTILPMFPLGSALLPGGMLPLHVFEPRYRALVRDCLAADVPEFGVALIERGSEVGGGDVRSEWGTVARMVQVTESPDGRYGVMSVGTRRIRVVRWLPDDPYPRAEVEDWPDGGIDLPEHEWDELVTQSSRQVRAVAALAVELGAGQGDPLVELPEEPVAASYALCHAAPLGPLDRHSLLGAPSPVERLWRLEELLSDMDAVLRFQLGADSDDE